MRISLVATIVASIVAFSASTSAQAAIKRPTVIPPQALAPALKSLVTDREFQIIYSSQLLADRRTQGATGELTMDEALDRLLSGTGLTYQYLDDKTVSIVPVGTQPKSVRPESSGIRMEPQSRTQKGDGSADRTFWSWFRIAQATDAPAAPSQPAPVSSQPPDNMLQEIVVTAQKRQERLKDVPMSISVLSGEDLDKSTAQGITEALSRVPGVAASPHSQTGGTMVSVRGASAASPVFAASSPVSYYLDSVPFGLVQTAIAPDANAYDLERVEVLRGPQGTLYGANAQAGVVRVLTKDADLDDFEFKVRAADSATSGGGNNYRGDLAANVPLIEGKLAARAVLGYENSSGWVDGPLGNDLNDARLRNGRLKVNAQPTDALSIGLSAWISRRDFGAPAASNENERVGTTVDESFFVDYDAYGMKVSYDFPAVSVSSSTSYLDYSTAGASDLRTLFGSPDSVELTTALDAQVFAQEINFASRQDGPWRWTAGAMYRDGEDTGVQTVPFLGPPGSPLTFDWTNSSSSYAVFGEVSRKFLDNKWEWMLGARYFHDRSVSREDQLVAPVNPPNYYRDEDTFDSTTPRAVLTWRPSSEWSIYGSYSEGFRSGSPQLYTSVGGVTGFPSARPDKLHNYEIGVKGGDNRLSFDGAVYYIDWKDVQQLLTVLISGAPVSAIANGKSASGVGVDLGVTTRPVQGLELGLDFSWNDLTMDAAVLSGSTGNTVLFAKGDRPNYSPEYTAGVFGNYAFPLGSSGLRGRFALSANYTSVQGYRAIVNGAQQLAFGESIFIARTAFSVQAPEHWELMLFADNLNNEKDSVVGNAFDGPDASVRVRPRTIGVQVDYRF